MERIYKMNIGNFIGAENEDDVELLDEVVFENEETTMELFEELTKDMQPNLKAAMGKLFEFYKGYPTVEQMSDEYLKFMDMAEDFLSERDELIGDGTPLLLTPNKISEEVEMYNAAAACAMEDGHKVMMALLDFDTKRIKLFEEIAELKGDV